ncbi:MAG: RNB domain-containing ribonuclease [Mollicutes bacterium]|nr:RNB domain-containing ribonuclease [Mollicutes bacterium]
MSSSKNLVELKNILRQHKYYKLSELKNILNVTDEQLIVLISQLIENDITHFNNYSSFDDYKNLYKCLNYLNELINLNIKLENSEIIFGLKKICNCLEEKINDFEKNKKRGIYASNEFVLNKIYKDVSKLINNYDYIFEEINNEIFDEKCEDIDNEKKSIYQFLKYLIIDVKNFNYVKEIFGRFPNLVNIKIKEEGNYLFDELIDEYIIQTINENDSDYYNVIYLKKVINYMIGSPNFKMNLEQKKEFTNRILQAIDNLKRIKISKKERERKKFFLNSLIYDIKDIWFNNYEKGVENINYKYNIHTCFNNYDIEKDCNLKKINKNGYLDLRNKYVITIDCFNTQSFEGALSVERLKNGDYLIGIYVTDVAAYIKAQTFLDQEAFARGKTIYLPKGNNISMIPEELTYNILSLRAKRDRLVIANLFRFSPNIDLVDVKIRRAIINVNENLTFDKVNKVLKKGNDSFNYQEQVLDNLLIVAEKLSAQNPNKILYHELKQKKKRLSNNTFYDNSIASKIVQEITIFVNHFIASFFFENNLPFIYRINQSKCNQEEIKRLEKMWNNNNKIEEIITCINKIYEPSRYSVNNLGHHGLNLSAYAHTTTPVRNYVSLVNQRLIKNFLIDSYIEKASDQYYYELEERLESIAEYMNEKNELYEDYMGEYMKVLLKNPIKKYIDKNF